MVGPLGFEPRTPCLKGRCSNQAELRARPFGLSCTAHLIQLFFIGMHEVLRCDAHVLQSTLRFAARTSVQTVLVQESPESYWLTNQKYKIASQLMYHFHPVIVNASRDPCVFWMGG